MRRWLDSLRDRLQAPPKEPDPDAPAVVAVYDTELDAELARSRLEAAGIFSMLTGQRMAQLNPEDRFAGVRVRLLVAQRDVEEAAAVLEERSPDSMAAPRR